MSGSTMEHNGGNQELPPPTLCRNGCGFYGNAAFDGMCSKCFKDALKRRNQQQNTSPTQVSSGRASPNVSASPLPAAAEVMTSSADSAMATSSLVSNTSSMHLDTPPCPSMHLDGPASIDTATPTVPAIDKSEPSKEEEPAGATGGEASAEVEKKEEEEDKEEKKKPKKNKCHTCKKKVGLTGFQCRCGGLYCGLHRYSDKHNCTFNYKEMAQEQIRKNNPVVVGEKIQKI